VKEGEQGRVTNNTLTKLQLAINNQWKVTCDKCRDDRRTYATPNKQPDFVKMVTICDGDVDRAEALWMFMNLRRAMPETFVEAKNPVTLSNAAGTVTVTLPVNTAFKEIQDKPKATGQPEEESAALLYIILGQGARGNSFALDDAMQGAQTQLTFPGDTPALSLPAFKDGFGTYVAFQRFYQSQELWDSSDLGRARDKAMLQKSQRTQPIDDPLDTVGRLTLWGNKAVKSAAENAVLSPYAADRTFNGRNRIATPISAGADARDQADNMKHMAFRSGNDTDNAYGYRVGRQGTKGD
jgi:hypothetical protein